MCHDGRAATEGDGVKQRAKTVGLALVVGALVAAACGSDTAEPATEAMADASDQTEADGSGSGSGLGLSADDPTVVRAGELAVVLVGNLGDDDTAAGALLLTGDAGYDGPQIEAAIASNGLAADGTIAGVEPHLAAYGKVAGFRSAQEEPLPIETLRQEAREEGGQQDLWPEGALATGLILQWQFSGYSQEQIVDMLILGVAQLDGGYDGEIAIGEEECGGYLIGGVHEIPQFCDPDTGELFADLEPEGEAPEEQADEASSGDDVRLCGGDFAPPYRAVSIEAAGVMLETEILGPLETPYYYTEVSGFIDIAADGTVMLTAHTVRYADITIRDAPDNQIYVRDMEASGSIDGATGDGELTGTGRGTDQLWSGDSQNPVSGDVAGQIGVVCGDAGFAIYGFVSGTGGFLEFDARP
jgi:hypothetical protein